MQTQLFVKFEMKLINTISLVILSYITGMAQELFIHSEPASNIPKGVLNVSLLNESYKEVSIPRNMTVIGLNYGIHPNVSFKLQFSASNHHDKSLSNSILNHYHNGNKTIFYTRNRIYGTKYKYQFNGLHGTIKWRLFNSDHLHEHFRIAAFLEGSYVRSAHDETEPRLLDDCSGVGGGLVFTKLYHKMAASVTLHYIKPSPFTELADQQTHTLYYGDAIGADVSLGYLIYPKKYSNYEEDNYNLYVEFISRMYQKGKYQINHEDILIQSSSLFAGHYVETYFGIQRIIRSNSRLDVSIGIPLYNQSFIHFYPIFTIGWRHQFYLMKRI